MADAQKSCLAGWAQRAHFKDCRAGFQHLHEDRAMTPRERRAPGSAGFTLIELLVIVAIIVLLIALLVPALGTARHMARAVICQSNMKQIGNAGFAYAGDNKGYIRNGWQFYSPNTLSYPGQGTISAPSNGTPSYVPWFSAVCIGGYLGNTEIGDSNGWRQQPNARVLYCSEAPGWGNPEALGALGIGYDHVQGINETPDAVPIGSFNAPACTTIWIDVIGTSGPAGRGSGWTLTTPWTGSYVSGQEVPYYVHLVNANAQCADGHNQQVGANGTTPFNGFGGIDPGTTGLPALIAQRTLTVAARW
jgi:type II secretory pathway pseudopilin PulG